VAHVSQRKDRLTAIRFTARHRSDGARRRDGGLGRIANAMLLDALTIIPLDTAGGPNRLYPPGSAAVST
jgi:hypothetical protein